MPSSEPSRQAQLAGFIGRIDREAVLSQVVGCDIDDGHTRPVEQRLDTYINESFVGLDLIEPLLTPDIRILEVGSGIGVLSAFLASEGFEVTGVEPGGDGYGFMPIAKSALDAQWGGCPYDSVAVSVDRLGAEHGRFDLAFSCNVLEHVEDPKSALGSIHATLTHDAVSRHLCPNYAIPFDPHFNLPLVPVRPELTTRVLPRRIVGTGLWRSLNFVTAGDIERIADELDLRVHFDRDVMGAMVRRLRDDEVFARRHPALAKAAGVLLRWRGTSELIGRWPPRLATPMSFTLGPR